MAGPNARSAGSRRVRLVNARGSAIRLMTYDADGIPVGSLLLEPEPGMRTPRIINTSWPREEWLEVAEGEYVPLKSFSDATVVFDEEEEPDVMYVTTAAIQQKANRGDFVMPTQIVHHDDGPEAGGLATNE